MVDASGEAAPRRDGPGQRPARPRADALGGGRAHARRRRSGSPRGASRGCAAASTACPGVRGVSRLAEAFAVIPLVKRALPEARLPFQDAAVARASRPRRVAGGALRAPARRGAGGEAAARRCRVVPALVALRGGEVAAYHGVEHKAIARLRAGRRRRARRRRRSTTAAARTSWRRCSRPTWPARCCCAASSSARPGWPRRASRWPPSAAAVEVFAWSERHADTRVARALRRPGYELQRAGRHARARRAAARRRPRRAGRDPARRGRRLRSGRIRPVPLAKRARRPILPRDGATA